MRVWIYKISYIYNLYYNNIGLTATIWFYFGLYLNTYLYIIINHMHAIIGI